MRRKRMIRFLAAAAVITAAWSASAYAEGWNRNGNNWQYVKQDGAIQKASWLKTQDGKWYCFDEHGNMRTGWYQDQNLNWYYLDADGSMAGGWRENNGKWYYFDAVTGVMLENTTTPDGYRVGSGGAWTGSSSSSGSGGSGGSSSGGGKSGSNSTGSNTGNDKDEDKNNGNDTEDDGKKEEDDKNDETGADKKSVPDFVGFIDAVSGATIPAIVDYIEITAGDSVGIELGHSGSTDYHGKLNTVTVKRGGEVVHAYTRDSWNNDYILTLNDFREEGQYQVLLAADGYVDKTLTAAVKKGSAGEAGSTIFEHSKCGVFNIEQVHYAVLTFVSGSLGDYELYLNDHAVTAKPVNDQQTVVKLEVNPREVIEITAVSRRDSAVREQVRIGTGTSAFTGVIQDEHPQYVLASGPISVFDYYLSNYDEDGTIRMNPLKSTFDTVAEGQKPVDEMLPLLSSPKTRLGDDIVISFAADENGRNWQNGIYAVQKDYGTGAGSRQPLGYSVGDGRIVVRADSTPIDGYNGKHTIIIKSDGYADARIVVELVLPAGQIRLSGNFNWWAGQDLLFELKDFNYAIVNPIYAVYLDGTLLEGDCHHYHIVSNLIRLERESHRLLTPGVHTLVVKAEGYEDYEKVFMLEEPLAGQQNPTMDSDDSADTKFASFDTLNVPVAELASVDGLTRATGGSSGGTSGSGSGGVNIRGNIIFEFDLLANARILAALGKDTEYSREVLSWWDSLTKDAIITQDGQRKLIDYTYYKNVCGQPADGDDYLTFYELYVTVPDAPENIFTEDAHPALYLGGVYQVKNMLEDGLLGELYYFSDATARTGPAVTVVSAVQNQGVVLSYEESEGTAEWVAGIRQITLNGYRPVTGYEVDKVNRTITIPANTDNLFNTGDNQITIYSEPFQSVYLTAFVGIENLSELEAQMNDEGDVVITGLTATYAKALSGVSLNGTGLFEDDQVGAGNGGYVISDTSLTLRARLFEGAKEEQYTLILTAYGYAEVKFRFIPSELERNGDIRLPVPEYVKLSSDNTYEVNETVTVILGDMFSGDYMDAVTSVAVNEREVENQYNSFSKSRFEIAGSEFAAAGDYSIVIYAKGYEDKQFDITIIKPEGKVVPSYVGIDNSYNGYGVKDQMEIEAGTAVTIVLGSFMEKTYVNKFTGVSISLDGDELAAYEKSDLPLDGFGTEFSLNEFAEAGKTYLITLTAEGYADKKLTVITREEEPVGQDKAVPSYVGIDNSVYGSGVVTKMTIKAGGTVRIKMGDSWSADYKDAFVRLSIERDEELINSCDADDLTFTGFYTYQFDLDDFEVEGDYVITLYADGYEDKELFVTVNPATTKEASIPPEQTEPEPTGSGDVEAEDEANVTDTDSEAKSEEDGKNDSDAKTEEEEDTGSDAKTEVKEDTGSDVKTEEEDDIDSDVKTDGGDDTESNVKTDDGDKTNLEVKAEADSNAETTAKNSSAKTE